MAIEPLKLCLVFGILDHSSDASESVLCMKQGSSGVSALSVYRSVSNCKAGLALQKSHVATAQKCACLCMEMTLEMSSNTPAGCTVTGLVQRGGQIFLTDAEVQQKQLF